MDNLADTGELVKVDNVIQVDEAAVSRHLDSLVRSSVEQALNGLLQADADPISGAYPPAFTHRAKNARVNLADCAPNSTVTLSAYRLFGIRHAQCDSEAVSIASA